MKTPPNAAFRTEGTKNDDDLDDLLNGGINDSATKIEKGRSKGFSKYHTRRDTQAGFLSNVCSYLWLLFLTHTRISKALSCVVFGMFAYTFLSFACRGTKKIGKVNYHMSNIQSSYDFDMGQINHWCIDGGDDNCICDDPLIPVPKEDDNWIRSHMETIKTIKARPASFRIAFVGSTPVAIWGGNYQGKNLYFDRIQERFSAAFPEYYKTIALGGIGDSAANVLFRLKRNILKQKAFNPDVFWIILGADDLTKWDCSEEVVIMGILRVVEELLTERPDSQIVINSLLPMTHMRNDKLSVPLEFEDVSGGDKSTRGTRGLPKQDWAAFSKMNSMKQAIEYRKKLEHEKGENLGLRVRNKYHTRDFFMRKEELPVWSAIHVVNNELNKFCSKHLRVTFFDATHLFVDRVSNTESKLRTNYISKRGHLTQNGFSLWEEAISQKLEKMISKDDSKPREYYGYDITDRGNSGEDEIDHDTQNVDIPSENDAATSENATGEIDGDNDDGDDDVNDDSDDDGDDDVNDDGANDDGNDDDNNDEDDDVKNDVNDDEDGNVNDDDDDDSKENVNTIKSKGAVFGADANTDTAANNNETSDKVNIPDIESTSGEDENEGDDDDGKDDGNDNDDGKEDVNTINTNDGAVAAANDNTGDKGNVPDIEGTIFGEDESEENEIKHDHDHGNNAT